MSADSTSEGYGVVERSARALRVHEAIPAPVRVVGWLLLLGPVIGVAIDGRGRGAQLMNFISERLDVLGLGAGVAPLEFLAFAWVAVALIFWAQARARGETLGRKSGLVMTVSLATQALLLVVLQSP